jgi:hypothetical protein
MKTIFPLHSFLSGVKYRKPGFYKSNFPDSGRLFNKNYGIGPRTFFARYNFKTDFITLIEYSQVFGFEVCMMDEYIRLAIAVYKAITLFGVEPLYDSLCHWDTPYTIPVISG